MPLSLGQIEVKAIVDWNIEWRKDCNHENCSAHQKEFHRDPIRRGMIVRVEGSAAEESVGAIWVTFGDDLGKDKFEVNGLSVPCMKVPAKELNLAFPAQSRVAEEAWKRTFQIPAVVGTIFQSKAAKGRKAKIVDKLQLSGVPSQGPISDGPSAMKEAEED